MTNLELYRLVTSLEERFPEQKPPSLEEYLRALLGLVRALKEPTGDAIAEALIGAFCAPPLPFDEAWRARAKLILDDQESDWEEELITQIVLLRMMRESGAIDDEQRFFGIEAPDGARWYNFEPLGYLECAVRGALGDGYRYEKSDEVDEDGFPLAHPVENPSPVRDSWDVLRKLLGCGRFYE